MSSLMCLVLRGESRLLLLPWESVLAPGVSKGPENMSFHRVMADTNSVIYCSESRRHPQHCLKIGRSTDSPTHSNHARTPRIGARSSAWNAKKARTRTRPASAACSQAMEVAEGPA